MSLHTASKYLASKGRKGDTELVHMTKDEIKGLQQLALAHGGSLTINPETGLVEAGILKKLLPMVGGAALMMIPGMQGFGGALAASAIMGGGMYAATGSVKEGLLAGLGAFGGANIASGLAAAGAEAGAAGVAEAGGNIAADTASQTAAQVANQGLTTSTGQVIAPGTLEGAANSISQAPIGADVTQLIPKGYELGSGQLGNQVAALQGNAPLDYAGAVGQTVDAGARAAPPTGLGGSFTDNATNAWKGLPKIGSVIMDAPLKTAGAALAPFAMGATDSGVQGFPPNQDSGGSSLSLSEDFQGYTPTQPNPYYKEQYTDYRKKQQGGGVGGVGALAEGGIAGLAGGGMDPMNPVQNPIYPQSQQEHTNFASSTQYPNSIKSAMAADYDTRTNPMTGQELPMGLAAGGVARYADGGMSLSDLGQLLSGQNNSNILAQYAGAKLTGQLGNNAAGTATAPTGPVSPGYVGFEGDTIGDGITPSNPFMRSATTTMAISAPASQTGWGQNAQGYNSFSSGSSSSGNTGTGLATSGNNGVFPLEGQYGIVKMASGTPKTLPRSPGMPDGGVYRDTDPDTYNKDAFTAAQIRLGKINKAAGLKGLTLPKANMTQLGGSFDSVEDKAQGGIAHYNLGGYSDGGRMLKGPGDGMSDSIPASIGGKQPARLADGEFVVPADVVSHLGNGSTDAGAKKLYGMMDKVRHARTGTKKQGKQIKADKYLPK